MDLEMCPIRFINEELLMYCMDNSFIKREATCDHWSFPRKWVAYKSARYGNLWRCVSRNYRYYKKHYNVRLGSIFKDVKPNILSILRIYYKYSMQQSLKSIHAAMNINIKLVHRVLSLILVRITAPDFNVNKLDGKGKLSRWTKP